jgi:hypothetical protein
LRFAKGYAYLFPISTLFDYSSLQSLSELSGFADLRDFQRAHHQWVEQALENGLASRDDRSSESIAVRSLDCVENIKTEFGMKAMHRDFELAGEAYAVRESSEAYAGGFSSRNEVLSSKNTLYWNDNAGT